MYYAKSRGMEGLGVIDPTGMTCSEIEKAYANNKKAAKERTKAEHRKAAAANVAVLEPLRQQCQGSDPGFIPSGVEFVNPVTGAPVADIVPSPAATSTSYTPIVTMVLGGAALIGVAVWLATRKKKS